MDVIKQRIEEKIGELMLKNKDFAEQFQRRQQSATERAETLSQNQGAPVVTERTNNIFGGPDEPAVVTVHRD